ncbi:MAG: sialate O-acetylesterase, partial [Verrucomicrobiota bacterium]
TLKSSSKNSGRIRSINTRFAVNIPSFQIGKQLSSPTVPTKENKAAKTLDVLPAAIPKSIPTETLKLPRLFCDHMILQQQTHNTFWGWAAPSESVSVTASWGETEQTQADQNGKWKLFLKTPSHGTGHSLTIKGKSDTIEITNVAVGEVWLCAGQSNMGWAVRSSFEAEKEADVDLPNLRIFRSAREHWHEPLEMQRDRLSHWKPCDPHSAAETSAVSYYFGKKIHLELGIPVGIIQQAYAGTPIEGWMPWDIQKNDPRAVSHKGEYDTTAERQIGSGQTRENALAEWQQQLDEYQSHIAAGNTMKNSVRPHAPPIITRPANLGHQYPGHQFNAMIYPIRPYGIRGMIWYQGERNAKDNPQAFHYRKQLAQLITYYRDSWHELSGGNVDQQFPVQFTQLPSWTDPQTDPVEGLSAPWAVSRESMRLVTKDVPNTAISVTIDTGDAVQLHPKNKKPIGIRHAYLALKQTYGKDFVDYGPVLEKQTVEEDRILLNFKSIGSGMVAAKPGKLDSFAIAGEDRKWFWADATIKDATITVSSPHVPNPVAVRYAWAMNPSQRNLLYNQEGIPASPFRTDDWPLFDPDAELVTVEKPSKPEEKISTDWERPEMPQ